MPVILIVVVQNEGVLEVGVSVGVLVGVEVGVDVGVEGVGVAVDVSVTVTVNIDVGVDVNVATLVGVGVGVGVDTAVPVEMDVGVEVDVAVPMAVMGVEVEVDTDLGFDVDVEDGGAYTDVFVGLPKTVAVLVANAVIVGYGVCVATNVPGVDIVADALADVEDGRRAENEAPGVRAASIHAGLVRIAGSTGSMNPFGLFVRKSLFGSSLDSTFVSSSHRGANRSAQPPAKRIPQSPKRRMKARTAQSRRSFSVALMNTTISRQAHIDCGAGIDFFVMTGAFDPNASMVRLDNSAGDGKSQAGSPTFEVGFAGGVQKHFTCLIELFKDKLLMARVNANPCIFDCDLNLRSSTGIFDG